MKVVMTEDMYSYRNNHNRRIKINDKEICYKPLEDRFTYQ